MHLCIQTVNLEGTLSFTKRMQNVSLINTNNAYVLISFYEMCIWHGLVTYIINSLRYFAVLVDGAL